MKLLIVLLVIIFTLSCVFSEDAYFAFKTHGSSHDCIFKVSDAKKIQVARNIISGNETETVHVMGRIKKSPKHYNPHYSFHIDPDTVTFFSMAIEVCDATIPYVEENLDEACGAFLPGCFWCPWSSTLTREVKASEIKQNHYKHEKEHGIHISIQ